MNRSRFVDYLMLPAEITSFEHSYLARMNRIAFAFLLAHMPAIMLVAWLADTSPMRAVLFTGLGLVGPCIAQLWLKNPRAVSVVHGISAMSLGGLLVHFGQGSMQIEMHFYFFVVLALEVVFANPLVIVTSAAVIAAHHALLWVLLPSSVFNYEAPFSVVFVHALFVVLESVAACYIARSFFDNVIGLERIVAARTAEVAERIAAMRLVLDNVGDGLVTVDRAGVIVGERSAAIVDLLGEANEGEALADVLSRNDAKASAWLSMGWEALFDDVLPVELAIDQLPKRARAGERHLGLAYRAILGADGLPARILVVVSDETAAVARAESEAAHHELLQVLDRLMRDRAGFLAFLREARELVELATTPASSDVVGTLRAMHTLKGNAALFGASSLAAVVHDVESAMVERGGAPTADECGRVHAAWDSLTARLSTVLAERTTDAVEVKREDVDHVLRALIDRARHVDVARLVTRMTFEPAAGRLARLGEQAQTLARRLGKGEIHVEIDDGDVRVPAERWSLLWGTLTHVLRNAIDHGLESVEQRAAAGKTGAGKIRLAAHERDGDVVIEVGDDGRGIDWDAVAAAAAARGLRAHSAAERVRALFADGVSTAAEVTEVSGRGVGLAAARDAAHALGGSIDVRSERGAGTTFVIRVPSSVGMVPTNPLAATAVLSMFPPVAAE